MCYGKRFDQVIRQNFHTVLSSVWKKADLRLNSDIAVEKYILYKSNLKDDAGAGKCYEN